METRSALLRAARSVFAQDGFQHARIEDIARKAGKTRGAFYAHFKDKEDVFFAIFESDLLEKKEELGAAIRPFNTLQERITALCRHLAHRAKSREFALLQIEFKAYAVRNPTHRERLAAIHSAMLQNYMLKEITELAPEMEDRSCSLALAGAFEGLTLNRMFYPGVISEDQMAHLTELVFTDEIRRAQAEASQKQPVAPGN